MSSTVLHIYFNNFNVQNCDWSPRFTMLFPTQVCASERYVATVLWSATSCCLAHNHRRLGGTCCAHLQIPWRWIPLKPNLPFTKILSTTSQNTVILVQLRNRGYIVWLKGDPWLYHNVRWFRFPFAKQDLLQLRVLLRNKFSRAGTTHSLLAVVPQCSILIRTTLVILFSHWSVLRDKTTCLLGSGPLSSF